MTTIDEALTALVRKYPGAMEVPVALRFLFAAKGMGGPSAQHAVETAVADGRLILDARHRLTIPGATPNPRRPPLPLTSPDGRVFAWACAHCLDVGSIPGIGGGTLDSNRAARAKASLRDAERCGECSDCHSFDASHTDRRITCDACSAALKARQPKGTWVDCTDCEDGTIAVQREGVEIRVQCPTCEGDRRVWRPE